MVWVAFRANPNTFVMYLIKFQRTLVFVMLFSLMFQCMASLGMLAWFEANQAYIAQNLCENRFRPAMHCQGQCVLMKKMRLIKSKQESDKTTDRLVSIPQILLPHLPTTTWSCSERELMRLDYPYLNAYSFLFLKKFKIPPKYLVS